MSDLMDGSWLSVYVFDGLLAVWDQLVPWVGGILADTPTANVLSLAALAVLLVTVWLVAWTAKVSNDAAGKLGGILRDVEAIGGRVEAVASHLERAAGALSDITRGMGEVTGHLQATVEAVERSRLEDRLLRQLERYERINAGVQTIVRAPQMMLNLGEQVALVSTTQAPMRAALAAIPGANGSPDSPLRKCWILAHGPVDFINDRRTNAAELRIQGGDVDGSEAEIDAAIRKVHEELGVLQSAKFVDALPRPTDEATAVLVRADGEGRAGLGSG